METKELFDVLTYDYIKNVNVRDVTENYQTIADLVTVSRPAGVYEYNISMSYNYNKTNKSVYIRYSRDGGSTWVEHSKEPKDITENMTFSYSFPKVWDGGVMKLMIQARKEGSTGVFNVGFIDAIIKRVK